MIVFSALSDAFSSGGNRLCFVDPNDSHRCIKLAKSERSPEVKRLENGFLGKFRTLAYFDENISDMKVYNRINNTIGDAAYNLIPKCYGFIETNLGTGLAYELIRDSDNKISLTLKQYVWQFGLTEKLEKALVEFLSDWQALGMPSRNLLLHNIVVQQNFNTGSMRLVVIDGLGWPDFVPMAYYIRSLARRKAERKSARLYDSIKKLILKKEENGDWGLRGWLDEEQRK